MVFANILWFPADKFVVEIFSKVCYTLTVANAYGFGPGGQNMKIYTIIGGVNGVGKSSFTGVLKSRTRDLGMIVDVDKITAQLGGKPLEGGKRAIHIMENCIRDGVSFTQETTLSGHRSKAAARKAKDAGYYVRLYYIGLNTAAESQQRIANRVAKGGHNIAAEDVERRFLGRWMAVQAVLPYCDEAVFYDNDNGFVEVAAYRNGELILEGDHRPKWLMELSEYLKDSAKLGDE